MGRFTSSQSRCHVKRRPRSVGWRGAQTFAQYGVEAVALSLRTMLHKHHRKRVHVRLFGKPPRARHLGRDVGVGADAPSATRRLRMGQRGIEVDKRDPAALASKMARGDVAMDEPRMISACLYPSRKWAHSSSVRPTFCRNSSDLCDVFFMAFLSLLALHCRFHKPKFKIHLCSFCSLHHSFSLKINLTVSHRPYHKGPSRLNSRSMAFSLGFTRKARRCASFGKSPRPILIGGARGFARS